MTPSEFLAETLQQQTLGEGSPELTALRERRDEVQTLLREKLGWSPTIRYGGSKAKGTMIKEAYDLDLICYFPRDDTDAGGTLEALHASVLSALSSKYLVDVRASAIRLLTGERVYFHVDVVPGRFVDDTKTDAFLHRTTGEKTRLKTNLDVHIDHVKGSGVVPAIRLMKLWRTREGLGVRHFALELLVIQTLDRHHGDSLEAQVRRVWTALRDDVDDLDIEDPANPSGNDLSELLTDAIRRDLAAAAKRAIERADAGDWAAIFGGTYIPDAEKQDALLEAAKAARAPVRPWGWQRE